MDVYNITPGPGGIMIPHNSDWIYCKANVSTRTYPFCEVHAQDSYFNPRLCGGGSVEVDKRPNQIGTPCSSNLFNAWLDIIVISDVSNNMKGSELDAITADLLNTFEKLNFGINTQHGSRISLITFSSLAKLQFGFGRVTNSTQLQKLMDLKKYSNKFDSGRNPLL